jgi:hypothetical protein
MTEIKVVDSFQEATGLLQGARGKIEQGWCQKFLAVDGKGCPVDVDSPNAVAWCISGSLVAVHVDSNAEVLSMIYWMICRALNERTEYRRSLPSYNDEAGRTKEDILSLFDRAIELANALAKLDEETGDDK